MFNLDEYTKTFENFFQNNPNDLNKSIDQYKAFSEKASAIIKESVTNHTDITQKWTEESFKNFEAFAKGFSPENGKASTDFVTAQTQLAPKYLEEYAENAKRMQVEFTELLVDSGQGVEKSASKNSTKAK